MRLGPLPAFDVSGDFSIGAWGFVGEPMDLIVSQCVYVVRQVQVVQQQCSVANVPQNDYIVRF